VFLEWGEKVVAMPGAVRLGVAIALVAVVGLLDWVTGYEISLSIFYLIPVAVAGGLVSRRSGAFVAVLAAAAWGYLDLTAGHQYSAGWIPIWNSAVRLGFFLIVNELIIAARRAHMRERSLSRTDAVTGIANSRVFEERVNRAIAESRRHQRPFTIGYLDLDGFKQVNDELGHSEGDRVLGRVAALIEGAARATDTVARLGGDEFGIFMPETGVEQARPALERIAAAVAQETNGQRRVGATLGAVSFTEPPADVDCAVREADALMYKGKGEGRGRLLLATWPENETAVTRQSQPQVDAASRS
jgi:diguanylate cyclase (GGDEF)-like protein